MKDQREQMSFTVLTWVKDRPDMTGYWYVHHNTKTQYTQLTGLAATDNWFRTTLKKHYYLDILKCISMCY